MERVIEEISEELVEAGRRRSTDGKQVDSLDEADVLEAYKTVLRLMSNIINNPKEEKYRIVKKSNSNIRQKLLLDNPGRIGRLFLELMKECGFVEIQDTLVYSYSEASSLEYLSHCRDLLLGVSNSINITEASSSSSYPPLVPSAPPLCAESPTGCSTPPTAEAISGAPSSIGAASDFAYKSETPSESGVGRNGGNGDGGNGDGGNGDGGNGDGGRGGSLPRPGGKKPSEPKNSFRRRDDDGFRKQEKEVQNLRAEQARRYKQHVAGPEQSYLGFSNPFGSSTDSSTPSASDDISSSTHVTNHEDPNAGGGGGGGISGFFSNLFGRRSSSSSSSSSSSISGSSSGRGGTDSARSSREGGGGSGVVCRRGNAGARQGEFRMRTLRDLQPPPQARGG